MCVIYVRCLNTLRTTLDYLYITNKKDNTIKCGTRKTFTMLIPFDVDICIFELFFILKGGTLINFIF